MCGAAPSSLRLLEIFRERTAPIFSSLQFGGFFKTHRGTLSNKSDLGDQGRRFVPELSFPFQMSSARVNDRATETKKIQAMKLQKLIHVLIPIACIALLPQISAVSPKPDGCYRISRQRKDARRFRALPPVLQIPESVGIRSPRLRPAVPIPLLVLERLTSTTQTTIRLLVAALLLNTTGTDNTATEVCRTVPQAGLEVTAHARGDPVGPRVPSTYAVRDVPKTRERQIRVGTQGGHGHDAAQVQQLSCRNGIREGVDVAGQDPATRRRRRGSTWRSTWTVRSERCAPFAMSSTSFVRSTMDDVGGARDVRRLVALEPADEVEGRRRGAASEAFLFLLFCGFLVAVLAEVPDAEVVKQQDVGRREELRDDDEGDVAVAGGRCAGQRPERPRSSCAKPLFVTASRRRWSRLISRSRPSARWGRPSRLERTPWSQPVVTARLVW